MQEAGTRAALLLQSAGNIAGKALQGQSTSITDTHTLYTVQIQIQSLTHAADNCTVHTYNVWSPYYGAHTQNMTHEL